MENQLDTKMDFFEKKINVQIEEMDKSHGNLKSEINNFFNLDEVNFSAINNKGPAEESEMFDLRSINKEITSSMHKGQKVIPQKKKEKYDFMAS